MADRRDGLPKRVGCGDNALLILTEQGTLAHKHVSHDILASNQRQRYDGGECSINHLGRVFDDGNRVARLFGAGDIHMRIFLGVCFSAAIPLLGLGYSMPLALAEAKEKPPFDPAALKDLPDNSWIDLGLPFRGGNEVPAVFDAANQLFFKYGGCRDFSPRINVEGSKRPNETYGNSCWVVNMATGKWEMRRPRDMSFPKDRPSNGCSRSYVYDSKRKLIWMYGGLSNGGGGGDSWDLWTYDSARDAFKKWDTRNRPPKGDSNGGDVFVYDSVRDLLIMPRGRLTWIYDPAVNTWEARKTPEGPVPPRPNNHYASMVFDPVSQCLIYPRAVPTGKKLEKLTPDLPSERWKPSEKGYTEYEFQTWSYDPSKNRWTNRKPARSPVPVYRNRFGLAYDSRNQAILLIGGSSDTWDEREENFNDVWRYDVAKNTWTQLQPAGPKPLVRVRECRHCAYDPTHNVVLFLTGKGSLWAYRYRNVK